MSDNTSSCSNNSNNLNCTNNNNQTIKLATNFVKLSEIEFSACMKGYYNGLNSFTIDSRNTGFTNQQYHRDNCIRDHEDRLQACYQNCLKQKEHQPQNVRESYCKINCTSCAPY
jgi:hypothetical protein